LLHPVNDPLAFPVMSLQAQVPLILHFDDLRNNVQDYYYEIIHCNYDWTPTDISHFEYIEGFTQQPVRDYHYSSNTTQPYVHYQIQIPNEDFQLKLSGNYIVKVYRGGDPDDVVLTERFVVVENTIQIDADIQKPSLPQYREEYQELVLQLHHRGMNVQNAYDEVKVAVLQNQNWTTAITNLKPAFVKDETLVYDLNEELMFPGGKEFRWFDIRSLRFNTARIRLTEFVRDTFRVFVAPDDVRSYSKYIYDKDINGQYAVEITEYPNEHFQADYALVNFTLPFKAPLAEGSDLYIYGELTNWHLTPEARLNYDFDLKAYRGSLYLKQGYYNYVYAAQLQAGAQPTLGLIEGNTFDAENDYQVLVYYRPFGTRYDKVIGYTSLNSMR
jgi:hypothetical protein